MSDPQPGTLFTGVTVKGLVPIRAETLAAVHAALDPIITDPAHHEADWMPALGIILTGMTQCVLQGQGIPYDPALERWAQEQAVAEMQRLSEAAQRAGYPFLPLVPAAVGYQLQLLAALLKRLDREEPNRG